MDYDLRASRAKELMRRGVLPHKDTIISADNDQILLTEVALRQIVNLLSHQYLKRKVEAGEVRLARNILDQMSTSAFYNMTYSHAIVNMAKLIHYRMKNPDLNHVGAHGKYPMSIHQWQRKTLGRLTADEHPYAYSAYDKEDGEIDFNDEIREDLEEDAGQTVTQCTDPMQVAMLELSKGIAEMNDIWRAYTNPSHLQHVLENAHAIRISSNDIALRDQYLPFDTRHRRISFNEPAVLAPVSGGNPVIIPMRFQWNVNPAAHEGRLGDLRVMEEVQEIIQMEVADLFIPSLSELDIFHERVTLLIEEFRNQSAYTADGTRFHFMFSTERIANPGCTGENVLRLTPIKPFNNYKFFYPIKRVEQITMTFRNPFAIMDMQSDILLLDISAGSPATFTVVNAATTAHGLTDGQVVYFDNPDSGTPSEDNLLSRVKGHIIDTGGSATAFDITIANGNDIDVNFTNSVDNVRAYVGCRRFQVPIHFKSLQ